MIDHILTFTGKHVNPLNLKPEDIDIVDIANSLSMMCRFGGQTPLFYSVGIHSILVSQLLESPEAKLLGLIHDATECYLMDIPRPYKHHVHLQFANGGSPPYMLQFKEYENKMMPIILEGLNIPLSIMEHWDKVIEADNYMLAQELYYFKGTDDFIIKPDPEYSLKGRITDKCRNFHKLYTDQNKIAHWFMENYIILCLEAGYSKDNNSVTRFREIIEKFNER